MHFAASQKEKERKIKSQIESQVSCSATKCEIELLYIGWIAGSTMGREKTKTCGQNRCCDISTAY
jgi:hypothetical protein